VASPAHPLEQTLRDLHAPARRPLPRPAAPDATTPLARFLEHDLEAWPPLARAERTTRELRPVAMDLVGELVWRIATPAVGVWAAAGRVLPAHASRVAVQPLPAPVESLLVRLSPGPFACLVGDPAARHPDATIVAEVDLAARWTAPLAGDCVPAILAAVLGLADVLVDEDALLAAAADAIANAFLAVGRRLDRERELEAAALGILARLPGGLAFELQLEVIETATGPFTYAVKTGCCASYARFGGRRCATCPERTREGRGRAMRAGLG
jgi:hypothetical protein